VELGLPVQPAIRHHHGYPAVDRRAGSRSFPADHAVLLGDHVRRVGGHADPLLSVTSSVSTATPDDQTHARDQGENGTYDNENENEHGTAERAMTRLVIDEARRQTVLRSTVQAQESLRGLLDGFLGLRQRWHERVLPRVESRVHARVVEHVVPPHGQHLAVAGLRDQKIVELHAEAQAVQHQRALLEIAHAAVLEDEIVQERRRGRGRLRRSGLAIRADTQKSTHADTAERIVLHDHRPARRHVERLALQALDHAVLHGHCPRALDDERVAPHDAHCHTVQHELVIDLDVVHGAAGHLIAEAAADHVQVAHVELLEGLRLRCLHATVL